MSFEDVGIWDSAMSRKDFERLLQKGVTHTQYLKMQQTERYLVKLFESVTFEEITSTEKKRIMPLLKQQSQDIWDCLLTGCLADAVETCKEMNPEQRYQYAWNRAEVLMIEEMYAPPHFTKLGKCRACGPVFLPNTSKETEVVNCPWCAIGFLSTIWEFENEQ